jgi:PAS domain S-box-containing protein
MTPDEIERRHPEGQPAAQEDWVRAILDSTADGIIAIDEAGAIQLFSAAAESVFGYREREVLGSNVNLLMPSPYYEEHDGYLARYHRTNEPHILCLGREVEGKRKDGTIFPLWLRVRQVAHASPRVYIGTLQDITERRRMQEALARSEEQYRDLYDNAPLAYFSVGVDGRIEMVNRRAAELLRCSREDLIGRPVVELYADTPAGKEKARAILERFRAGEELRGEELEMRAADGRSVWVSLAVRAVRDQHGHTVESRSMVVDITARKRMEDELRKARNEMGGLVALSPAARRVDWADPARTV